MILSAYLGVSGLLDVAYQFFNGDETSNGSVVTAGIVDAGSGWYSADASVPDGAASVRWASAGSPDILAREYFPPPQVTALDPAQITQIADEVLMRDWEQISGEADMSLLQAVRSLRNRWEIDANGILRVYREDGTTLAWQKAVISTVNAVPIVGVT